jgi:flagellar basal-body rod modification protein FlgD
MLDIASATSAASNGDRTKAEQSQAKLEEDLNKFLNLLVTQLKNQDPLDPMDATEFTSQLVQFASVEQQIYQNSNLEKLLDATHAGQVSNLAGFLGKTVEGTSDKLNLDGGSATFSYELMDKAKSNTILITDASGKSVFSFKGELQQDRYEYTWDGKDKSGNQLPDGVYTINVAAKDEAGKTVDYKTTVYGRVTAAGADSGEVTLHMGDVTLPLGMVLSIKDTPAASTPAP